MQYVVSIFHTLNKKIPTHTLNITENVAKYIFQSGDGDFQQAIGIKIGTISAPLLASQFIYLSEFETVIKGYNKQKK